jgi:hypothetical protein
LNLVLLACRWSQQSARALAGVLLWRRSAVAHAWATEWWRRGVDGGPDGKYRRKYHNQTALMVRLPQQPMCATEQN